MIDYIKKSLPDCKTVNNVAVVGKKIPDGWLDLRAGIAASSDELERIPNKSTDEMLIYFSSGTTGMPKMILHDYSYPLGHITADGQNLHGARYTVSGFAVQQSLLMTTKSSTHITH